MGVCDIPMISTICATGEETASDLMALPFEWLATAMGEAAAWMFESVWSVFDTTTLVDITNPGYVSVYNLLFGIAVFVMLIFFCLQLLTGLIRRDPTALTRAALGLAKSVLGSFVVITLTALLLEIIDQLCVGIIQAAGETTETMGDKITLLVAGLAGLNITSPTIGPIVTIFLAGLAIGGAAIVWLSLLIRKALLLVAIVFAPLAFAGAAWDATKGWITKWAMFVIALICSKLVVVVMFLVAVTQVAAPIEADLASISDPLAGIVLMLLAGFAPYLTYKFISFIGFDMYHAMSSEQEAKSALNRPVPTPTTPPAQNPPKVLNGATAPSGGTSSGAGSSEGAAQAAGGGSATATGGGAGAGAGAGGGTGATAGAGAAAAGPAAAAAVAATVAKDAATAGPRAGTALAAEADSAAAATDASSQPTPGATSAPTGSDRPAPSAHPPSSPPGPSHSATMPNPGRDLPKAGPERVPAAPSSAEPMAPSGLRPAKSDPSSLSPKPSPSKATKPAPTSEE